eukprot:TRINITY_DN7564_c0_g1_i3.p1 TRINITY_DN7564_c0_g1~~TRINITY_DN7564_c0_g1_i3.p1  ORF type:complete len:101 (-),score=18.38 TRINITY_DN7564_c0_g1_i3:25-327(-)
MYNLSGMKFMMRGNKVYLLADGGYSDKESLVVPDKSKSPQWNDKQKTQRSVVETVIGLVHNWEIATEKFKGSPELQELVLLIIYEFVNMRLALYPLGLRQ